MKLTTEQESAVDALIQFVSEECSENSYFSLIGHSGSGKTTTIGAFLDELVVLKEALEVIQIGEKDRTYSFQGKALLTATTNKAASALREASGRNTSTIHSALGLYMKKDFSTGNFYLSSRNDRSLSNCVVVIDEVSMMDTKLMEYVDNICSHCKIIFVGDDKQLKPINSKDMPAFRVTRSHRLKQVIRQNAGSSIPVFGENLRQVIASKGVVPDIPYNGVDLIHCDGPQFQAQAERIFLDPNYQVSKGRILCYRNVQVAAYNDFIRGIKYGSPVPQIGESFVTRAPVMLRNGRVAFPTDSLVQILEADLTEHMDLPAYQLVIEGKQAVASCFLPVDPKEYEEALKLFTKLAKKSGRWDEYFSFKEGFADLRPVYSGTTHTAQGSTYDEVLVDLNDLGRCRNKTDVARLLYVATTRARKRVFFYGGL